MTIRQKIQSLLTAINNRTGVSDTNLTDAISRIIAQGSGSGSVANIQIGIATVTPSQNTSSITISNLSGKPKWFILSPSGTITGAANSRRITCQIFDGTNNYGNYLLGASSGWQTQYTVSYDATNYSHTYSNDVLTLNANNSSTGGVYVGSCEYKLIYGYEGTYVINGKLVIPSGNASVVGEKLVVPSDGASVNNEKLIIGG